MNMRIGGLALGLGALLACGGPPEPMPELTPVPADVLPAPPPPSPAAEDAGPDALPPAVAEALSTVVPRGRRVRCEAPPELAVEGYLSAVSLKSGEAWLLGPTVKAGWFAAAVPTETGAAAILRNGAMVGLVRWEKAAGGVWTACQVEAPTRYTILGLVEDAEERPMAGVKVHGCDRTATVTNAEGRFKLQGYAGHPCAVVAWTEGPSGLGRSDLHVVESDGADAILEVQIPVERVQAAQIPELAKAESQLMEVQLRNGVQTERVGLARAAGAVTLSAEARAVVDGWLADLDARNKEGEDLRLKLAEGTQEALLAAWLSER